MLWQKWHRKGNRETDKLMFTIADIREIAIQIERNGEEVYRRAGNRATDPEMAEVFKWMATEEKRHACFFAKMTVDAPLSPEQSDLESMGRSLLQEMVRDKTFSLDRESLNATEDLDQVLNQSKEFEEDTILFYEFLRNIVDDEGVKRQLSTIIAEERSHADLLAGMIEARSEGMTESNR